MTIPPTPALNDVPEALQTWKLRTNRMQVVVVMCVCPDLRCPDCILTVYYDLGLGYPVAMDVEEFMRLYTH